MFGTEIEFFVFWGRAASAPLALSSRAWTGSYPFFFFFLFLFFTRCSCKWNDWGVLPGCLPQVVTAA